MPDSAKSTIAFIISSFILKGIAFITTPIFTRIMDASQYGIISNFNSWMLIIEVFALLGLTSAGVFNVGLSDYKDSRDSYIVSLLCLCNITTVVVFGVIFLIKYFLGEEFILPVNQLVLMLIYLLFSPAQIFWITRKKYEFTYKLAFCVTIASTIFSQAVSIIAVKSSSAQNLGEIKLWSQHLTSLIFVLPIYIHIFIKGKLTNILKYWKQVLVFALPLIPHYLAQHISSGAGRIMLNEMVSSAATGIYSVVSNISVIASVVWGAINASLIAFTFENIREGKSKNINGVVVLLLMGYALVCVSIALIAPDVMKILAPEEYYAGVYAVPPVLGVVFLSALYNVYANIEFYHKKTGHIAVSTIIATVVNVGFNLVLIPKFTFVGAAYATLISNVVLVFLHYKGYKKCSAEPVYNSGNIFLIALSCVVACILCSCLYANSTVRYLLVACILVLFIYKRKIVVDIIKNIRK